MVGAESEVSSSTRRIVFESAWFLPASVRATSKALGLKTEASMRFERGADLSATARAMARATELLVAIGAGQPLGPAVDVYPRPFEARTVKLDPRRVSALLGMEVPEADAERIGFGRSSSAREATDTTASSVPSLRCANQRSSGR